MSAAYTEQSMLKRRVAMIGEYISPGKVLLWYENVRAAALKTE